MYCGKRTVRRGQNLAAARDRGPRPQSRCGTLDGRDRSTIAGPEWRRLVGYVPAEPGWWAETVGEHFRDWTAASACLRKLGFSEEAGAGRSPGCPLASGYGLRLFVL